MHAINTFAEKWVENGRCRRRIQSICKLTKTKVTFPWSMIDKITPRPDASVEETPERKMVLKSWIR